MKRAWILMLLSFAVFCAAGASDPGDVRIAITNLAGVWTNSDKNVLTISSVEAGSGVIIGNYRSAAAGSGEARTVLNGLVHMKGVAGDNTNRIRGVSFWVDWGGAAGVKEWAGFYTRFDGKEAITGIWVRRGQGADSELDKQLAGKETFGRRLK
jgi:hypothetical protein